MKSSDALPAWARRALPPLARVRQRLDATCLVDPRAEVRRSLLDSGRLRGLRPGARVAITAGSRGLGRFAELLAGIADAVRAAGGEPFLLPSMGSHGGATAQGQAEILRRLGATEAATGAPVRSSVETRTAGRAANGARAHVDRLAAEADGVIVFGRTQVHPETDFDLGSGLCKMCTIGLGNQAGAMEAHRHGLWDSVRLVPPLQFRAARIVCGVAVVENAYREPCLLEIVEPSPDAFLESDRRLLLADRARRAHLPFRALDLLVVDEIGKTISGAGMDPHVIGHGPPGGDLPGPRCRRIVALSLTEGSLGNGLGIGLADFTTRRFVEAYDPALSYINLVTASEPANDTREGPLPLALATDREALEVGLASAVAPAEPRVCRIRNTATLEEFWASAPLLAEIAGRPELSVVAPPEPVRYDADGNLADLLQEVRP